MPAAIGLPAVTISEVGMWGVRTIEKQFSSPRGSPPPRLSGGGMLGVSAGVMRDITQVKLSDPALRTGVQNYIADCVIPALYVGDISSEELVQGEVWSAMAGGAHNFRQTKLEGHAGRGGESDEVTNGIMSCHKAYDRLSEALEKAAPSLLRGVGTFQLQGAVGDTTLNNVVDFVSAGTTQDATALAAQTAMIELASEGYKQAAIATDSQAVLLALNTEQARRSQTTGWFTASILFQDMAGYLFALLQAFVIGLTPLVAAILLVPGMGMKIAGGYARVMVWLMLWWPGLAIVNYIMELYLQSQVSGLLGAGEGINMANIKLISVASEKMVLASGFMATLVPGIMWGIISGSGAAFSSAIDRASGASYATQAAGQSAAGSSSMGQISMNSTAMNKHDTSWVNRTGMQSQQSFSGGGAAAVNTHQVSGDEMLVGNEKQTHNVVQSLQATRGEAANIEQSWQKQYQQEFSAKAGEIFSNLDHIAQRDGLMENGELNFEAASQNKEFVAEAQKLSALDQHAENQQISEQERLEFYGQAGAYGDASASAGFTLLGIGGNATAGLRAETGYKQGASDTLAKIKDLGKQHSDSTEVTDGSEAAQTTGQRASSGETASSGRDSGSMQSHANSEEFAELNKAAENWQEAKNFVSSVDERLSVAQSTNFSSGMNHVEWNNYLEDTRQTATRLKSDLDSRKDGMEQIQRENPVSENLETAESEVQAAGIHVQEGANALKQEVGDRRNDLVQSSQNDDLNAELRVADRIDTSNERRLDLTAPAPGKEVDIDGLEMRGFEIDGQQYEAFTYTTESIDAQGNAEHKAVYSRQNEDLSYDFFTMTDDGNLKNIAHVGYDAENGRHEVPIERGLEAGVLNERGMAHALEGRQPPEETKMVSEIRTKDTGEFMTAGSGLPQAPDPSELPRIPRKS